MEQTLGRTIAELRKQQGITQEALAEGMGVSPQAVSKWENDISCPDILILPQLAAFFHVTVDELLSGEKKAETWMIPEDELDVSKMMLRVMVDSVKGDKVRVNLPMTLVQMALEIGTQVPQAAQYEIFQKIDFKAIIQLVSRGAMGKLVEVDSADGDHVEVFVE